MNDLSKIKIKGSSATIRPMQIPVDWDLKDGDYTLQPHMLAELALSDLSTMSKTEQDIELVKMKRLMFAAGLKFLEESSPMFKEITMADFYSEITGFKELQMPDEHKGGLL